MELNGNIKICDIPNFRNMEVQVFSESEAKFELSKVNLDYTFLSKLFIEFSFDDEEKFYIQQFNFNDCVTEIHRRKAAEINTFKRGGW